MWWFLFGLIMGAGVMRLIVWLQAQNMLVSWYVWLMGAMALFLATLTVQHFFASLNEAEPKAAWMGVLIMGVPTLILAGMGLWFLFNP
ncbi:MAG: hypothetical protein KAV87_40600 [Desulfobacteraceae bacterium]|nr:hypothetical protein [Desulfobacteraceae bacterium]